jgi:magnesium transporter
MINTLYLPELREDLAENNTVDLEAFCSALHPARAAEFMEGLTDDEIWSVLKFAEPGRRVEILSYFDHDRQVHLVETQNSDDVAHLLEHYGADDRVDILKDVSKEVVNQLLPKVPVHVRRDIQKLLSFPEGTAGAMMTSDFAKLGESLTVRQAIDELSRQASQLETIYYVYVVDAAEHLKGVVSARQLLSALSKPQMHLSELIETNCFAVKVFDDQEDVARIVAKYDLLAIPVVDAENRMVGIITHDDVIDVVREEATEDAQRIGGVAPLEETYLKTPFLTLSWKRGIWLVVLFFAAVTTAMILDGYEENARNFSWLIAFIPLIASTGGNSGNQSATLIITALAAGDVTSRDWKRVIRRELATGLLLGGTLSVAGYIVAATFLAPSMIAALVIPITILLVVTCGTLIGSSLPILFRKMGLDPALMSNPCVAGILDILGILIFFNVALTFLPWVSP